MIAEIIHRFDSVFDGTNALSLLILIKSNDPYHFMSLSCDASENPVAKDVELKASFSHYLIQKGILSTLMPQTHAYIHELFLNYYEKLLEDALPSIDGAIYRFVHLSKIIHHVTALPHMKEKQWKYYMAGLESAVETGRFLDGVFFENLLENLYKSSFFTELNTLERANYYRLIQRVYFLHA